MELILITVSINMFNILRAIMPTKKTLLTALALLPMANAQQSQSEAASDNALFITAGVLLAALSCTLTVCCVNHFRNNRQNNNPEAEAAAPQMDDPLIPEQIAVPARDSCCARLFRNNTQNNNYQAQVPPIQADEDLEAQRPNYARLNG
jgi:hypothetical protein